MTNYAKKTFNQFVLQYNLNSDSVCITIHTAIVKYFMVFMPSIMNFSNLSH